MSSVTDENLLKEFLIESYDGLSSIKSFLNDLEKNSNDIEIINSIFRIVHTLKGSSSFLGFINLRDLAHSVEGVLDVVRSGSFKINNDAFEILNESFDLINEILKEIESKKTDVDHDLTMINIKLSLLLEISATSSGKKEEEMVMPTEPEMEMASIPEAIVDNESQTEVETESHPIKESSAPASVSEDLKKVSSVSDSVVKVNVKLLDQIMNIVGELVVNRNQILQYSGKMDDFELQKLTHQLDVITSDLQNEIMATRMQPVGQVLNKFDRLVRELSRSQNKKVQLLINGQDTELDKTLVEAIKDPLTHLVRNAVDHGIEIPELRLEKNKPEVATLKLMAFHENGKVSIKIQDDGRGIDPQKIKDKALEKNIISKELAEKLSSKEIVNLIFAPGFSTAEKITDISGRGVGMDVVKTNIEKIGGEIDIYTQVGQGTTFTLRIPLTLAIIPALTIYSSGKAFCIPQLNIVEFVLLDRQQNQNKLHQMHGVCLFKLREKLIPIYSLSKILDESEMHKSAIGDFDGELLNIVVVNGDGQEYGIVVDTILDIEEIVVKPLSRNLKSIELYSGATVMGNGEIALILETSSIIKKLNPNRSKNDVRNSTSLYGTSDSNDGTRDFLVFNLRDMKKYALSLSFIDRIEEFDNKDVNFSSHKIFVKYRDQVVPLIDVQACIDKKKEAVSFSGKIQVLIINVQGHLVGLIVNQIIDTQFIASEIDEFANSHSVLSGTVFVEDEAILILNLASLLKELNIVLDASKGQKTLLHVDDSKMHRGIFRDIVQSEFPNKFNMESFPDAMTFINYAKKNKALVNESSIIVSDIEMPGMTGWEMIKELRNDFKDKNLNIVTLTTRDSTEDRDRSKDLNVTHHIKKFSKSDIVSVFNSFLNISSQDIKVTPLVLSNPMSKFCGFKIGKEVYAIPIEHVQEIVKAQAVSKVPKSTKQVKGLINLRGQIVTSVWMGNVFNYSHDVSEEHMNIIVRNGDCVASLIVDEILDVMEFEDKNKSHVPDNIGVDLRKYFECVFKGGSEIVTIVNIENLLEDVL